MLGPAERAPHRPSPSLAPLPLIDGSLGPVVMADDPCEAASSAADPTGPRKYYRARYYDPSIGRFISEDPIGFEGGINFFTYVENNPANWTDPWGLDTLVCTRPMHGAPDYTHTYVFSTQANAGWGLGPKGGWKYVTPWVPVPGVIEPDNPFDPNGKKKPDHQCNPVDKDDCVEKCVQRKANQATKKPPKYRLGRYQCDHWVNDIIGQCRQECGK